MTCQKSPRLGCWDREAASRFQVLALNLHPTLPHRHLRVISFPPNCPGALPSSSNANPEFRCPCGPLCSRNLSNLRPGWRSRLWLAL